MECFACEVVATITDYYSKDGGEGTEIAKDILFYLYHTTTDDKLKRTIVDWFNEENYCVDCGQKLQAYDYTETHTELYGNLKEYYTAWLCPICDRKEIEEYDSTI